MAVGCVIPWAYCDGMTLEYACTSGDVTGLAAGGPLLGRIWDRADVPGDGWLVLALAFALAVLAALSLVRGRLPLIAGWTVTLLAVGLVTFELSQYVSEAGALEYYTQPHDALGSGLWVVAGGALLAAITLALETARKRPRSAR